MKNSNSFSILFWINRAKADTNGYVPLCDFNRQPPDISL